MRTLKRLLVMAVLGALGALIGAAGGEALFLEAPLQRAEPGPRNLCLVFDLSESMRKSTAEGVSQLESLRTAAHGFLANPDFAGDAVALVGFSDDARLIAAPSRPAEIDAVLGSLSAGGRTDIARGLQVGGEVLASAPDEERWILLFTDGKPQTARLADPVEEARLVAKSCRDAGVRIVAVGTGLADRAFLEELTGDPASVFVSAPGALGSAFQSSSEHITNRQMLASTPAAIGLEASLKRACGWAALVAFGTGLALVSGHNRHLRRRRMRVLQVALVLIGATASGLVAGAAGQGTFWALSGLGALEPVLRTLSWLLLGSGVVLGMSFFVPNLPRARALVGGALGGAAAVACFLRIVPALGDTPGRLLGAALLGLMAGAMTVLVEASVRKAWLVVRWPGDETTTLLLGPKPIVVGHSGSAHICPVFDESREAVVGSFTLGERGVLFEDARSRKARRLRNGERLSFDPVVVEVHVEVRAEGGSSSETTNEPDSTSAPARSAAASEREQPRAALPTRSRPIADRPGSTAAGAPARRSARRPPTEGNARA